MYENEVILDINNSKHNILILSTDSSNPVLLFVHGGPGSPDRPLVRKYNSDLAKYFTLVCWDQRGSGLSFDKRIPLTVDLMLSDLKEVVLFLIKRFRKDKIYLAGHSWGAYLGVQFAKRYPQYIEYYIGTGQGVSSLVDEIYKYNFVLKMAAKSGDKKVSENLRRFGEPVGTEYKNDSEKARQLVGKLVHKYGGYIHPGNNFSTGNYLTLYVKCYGKHIFKVLKGISFSVKCLNDEINSEDRISVITQLDVPVLLISGEFDYVCPVDCTKNRFDNLSAPSKKMVIIKNGAHMVNFEKSDAWNKAVTEVLL
ncbi:MAG: alpha/beta fold hydrolase [Acutalibacteraceae bacterium]